MKPVVAAFTLLALLTPLAACGSEATPPASAEGVRASLPLPENVQDPAEIPSAKPAPDCDPRASLRPAGALPAPGRMPAGSTMAKIVARGRLIVGIDQNAYLFGYRDPNTGDLVGFEIDIARAMAQAIFGDAKKIQFLAITTADRIPVLQNGKADMVVRTMSMTCERWQQVSFSTEYLTSHQRLLVRKGSGIKEFTDLGGRKVCATRGSTSIVTIAEQPSKPIPVATDSTLDCLVMLQQGQVDAVSTIDVLLAGLAAQDPSTEVVGKDSSNEPSGVGISKNSPDLVRFANGVLEKMRADGSWTTIYNRWLRQPLGPAPAPPAPVYRD
ncbi:polar amino acid transport system substrate-binding protein [Actinoplanes octamycinicus]|uniref:Polar amino acid transport system substrate-binding protein n=1 Tax=Actinoplanes octamycinicus TaxID=135948 RepID=A0A7W7M8M3_9ACTN|nr:glutamate ABC transporter substrate-binding protein [Actinoplanes octamycinicus]MBB4741034.1 polar amino acid transport system substrate-binding protein [Actinoplanes octamycinicus]GIE55939.1 ABC transporter substrate-binding protein [Actinoplanes octamycinicus]